MCSSVPGRGAENKKDSQLRKPMSLSVDFMGFSLKNPLMLTEGPLSGTAELIRKAAESRAGLIFTKGIRPEAVESPVPYIRKYMGSLINADWSCIGLREWLKVIHELDIDTPLITSIAKNYVTPDQAVDMAEALVSAGSRAISFVDYDPAQLLITVKAARKRIKVPIMVKLPPFLHGIEELLKNLENTGIDGIAAMDSIGPVLSIDTGTGEPLMGSPDGSGYLSGKYILSATVKYIYEISRFVSVPVVGVGGVTDTDSALQMIMAGATGAGMVTEPILKGLESFEKVEKGLQEYIEQKDLSNISQIRGLVHKKILERGVSTLLRADIESSICTRCGNCERVCYAGAVYKSKVSYTVDRNKCVGCGLCASVCPVAAVSFR